MENELNNENKNEINENNNTNEINNSIFLYNPWDKTETINYYWTANSIQKVKVHLYNPLSGLELRIQKLIILL